jgi:hypothetical protein
MRIALLANVFTPYRLPVYQDLAATPGFELRVMLSARTEYHWKRAFADAYEAGRRQLSVEQVGGISLRRRVPLHRDSGTGDVVELHLPLGIPSALRRARPDVIVSAEIGARTALAAAYAALFRVPLVIWSYSSRAAHEAASAPQRLRRRLLLTRADAVVGMGFNGAMVLLTTDCRVTTICEATSTGSTPL